MNITKTLAAAALLAASSATLTAQDNLLKPTNEEDSWRFEEAEGGKGTMAISDDAVVFTVTETTGTAWHVQALMPGLDLEDGQSYTLKFELKNSARRMIQVNAMIDEEDWHQIGLHQELYPPTEFRSYEFSFQAAETADGEKNRISFVLGEGAGETAVRNVSLTKRE